MTTEQSNVEELKQQFAQREQTLFERLKEADLKVCQYSTYNANLVKERNEASARADSMQQSMLDLTTKLQAAESEKAHLLTERATSEAARVSAESDVEQLRSELLSKTGLASGWRRRFELTHGRYTVALDFLRLVASEDGEIPFGDIRHFINGGTHEAMLMARRIYAERQVLNACSKLNVNRMKNWAHSEYISRDRQEDAELARAELALRQILKEEAELYGTSSESVDKVDTLGVSTVGHTTAQEIAAYVERRSNNVESSPWAYEDTGPGPGPCHD